MTLDELRHSIDEIDDALLELLARRAEIVVRVAEAKREKNVYPHDPEREQRLLARLRKKGAGRFPADAVERIYREIMSASVAMQSPITVAYLGPEGTFSHQAARQLFGLSARYLDMGTLPGVLDAVRREAARYAVVPLANSTEGPVTDTADALLEGGVQLRGEVVLEISHSLLGRAPGLGSVERVYSHPQALGQCRGWLAKHLPRAQLVQTSSTAAAMREAQADPSAAALGSDLCMELYGLPLLRERVQDRPENATRFGIIALQDAPRTGRDKTTIAFTLREEHATGSLRQVLERFEEAGVNLTHIESRPSRQKAWQSTFLADLEGHREDPHVARGLDAIRSCCGSLQLLGSYPRAAAPSPSTSPPR